MNPATEQLRTAIDSIAKVDLLEFFHKNRGAIDTAFQLAVWAGRSSRDVASDLESLAEAGILRFEGEGAERVFYFRPTADMEAALPLFLESARKGSRRTEILKIEKENVALRAMSDRLEQEIEARDKSLDQIRELLNQKMGQILFLQKVTNIVLAASDAPDLFGRLARELETAAGFDAAAFLLLDEKVKIYLVGGEGYPSDGFTWITRTLRQRFERVIPVSMIPEETVTEILAATLGSAGAGLPEHLTSVPLYRDRKPTGLIAVARSAARGEFADGDTQLLEIVAAQLSIALENFYSRAQVAKLAITDDLTGIFNKRQFRTTLKYEFDRARIYGEPLALLMLDIDHFKRVNDTFGHAYGDIVLSEMAGIVRQQLRPTDTFARYGGEEFGIILPHTALDGCLVLGERVRRSVAETVLPPPDERGPQQVTVSIGAAVYDSTVTSPEDLVAIADRQLYRAKNSGRNRVSG